MHWITDPQAWIALITLTALEIVLGIDNIVFLSIVTSKLPLARQAAARRLGLGLAMFARVGLLFSISWVMGLGEPLFSVFGKAISGRDLILILGGLFLLAKSTTEIHSKIEQPAGETHGKAALSFSAALVQIILLDLVFSLDSVITAVGMASDLVIMVLAVVIAVGFMQFFSGAVSDFVEKHPTVKMLALSFLLMIGLALVADGFGTHVPKGYIYFAMGFSLFVEMLNLRLRATPAAPRH